MITQKDLDERRLKYCVEQWPECSSGEYNPACCRFPKSCSPHGYIEAVVAGNLTEDDLEPAVEKIEVADNGADRDNYTWDMAQKDLALLTHLTFQEAFEITYIMRGREDLHPYDALPVLEILARFLMTPLGKTGADIFGRALVDLLEMSEEKALAQRLEQWCEKQDQYSKGESPTTAAIRAIMRGE